MHNGGRIKGGLKMITSIVSFVRQNAVNDIFKIATVNTTTHDSSVRYVEYPRSMDMNEDDVRELEV